MIIFQGDILLDLSSELWLAVVRIYPKKLSSKVSPKLHKQPKTCNFIKKEALVHVFSYEFCEIPKNTFFTKHLWTTVFKQIHNLPSRETIPEPPHRESDMLYAWPPISRELDQSKTLCNYYQTPAVNPCLHFASLEQYNTILSSNSIPPSLLTTLPPFPNCHLITFPPLRPWHLTILPPFPRCHFTPFMHLSHLPSSLLSHLSQLTSLPTTNRYLQNSNVLSLGRQGKHMWLIVRQPLMKAGWWDAPRALRDLAEAVNIKTQTQTDIKKHRQILKNRCFNKVAD